MQVVILCGGRGTRLGRETDVVPKPMVEVGSRPILWHIMKLYAAHGHTDFVLCLGYKGELIKRYFAEYDRLASDLTVRLGNGGGTTVHDDHDEQGWQVTLADTGAEAQTGARVKRASRYLTGDRFALTYGDGVADVDLAQLLAFHASHGKLATVTAVHPPARFGELALEADGQVERFSEKPQTSAGLINGGFFICEPGVLDYLTTDDDCVLETAPLARLVDAGQLMAYTHHGFWHCVDTVRELGVLRRLWDSGQAPWKVW